MKLGSARWVWEDHVASGRIQMSSSRCPINTDSKMIKMKLESKELSWRRKGAVSYYIPSSNYNSHQEVGNKRSNYHHGALHSCNGADKVEAHVHIMREFWPKFHHVVCYSPSTKRHQSQEWERRHKIWQSIHSHPIMPIESFLVKHLQCGFKKKLKSQVLMEASLRTKQPKLRCALVISLPSFLQGRMGSLQWTWKSWNQK